ncbi:lipopolysaccharide biosynthesis protein [Candidatus Thiodiazotropha sp. CDECU1]|uniref:lipopolysaccharide biosynthesis protein n=1 Tax=Candidatus Thiodiazotropha sp. CDECU1 TaxID=3065865 RepID=UPI0029308AEB|nr:oligosaccharide flippase family protein [Candidatus Thiodiazotropha sp. CDECU1]
MYRALFLYKELCKKYMREMEIKRKAGVKKQITWGVIGQLTYIIGQFVVLSALARFASPEDVGRFALAGAIIMPVFAFFNLGLRFNQATDIVQESTLPEFIGLRVLTTTLGFLIILCVGFLLIDDDSTRLILIIFGLAKAVETFSDLFYGVFQIARRMELVARSQVARSLFSSLLFCGILINTESVEIAFTGHLVSWLLVAVLFDYRKAKRVSPSTERTVSLISLLAIARQSLPLGLAGFLSMLNASVPRLVIESFMGLAALGYFTVIAYALQAGITIVLAISHSITSTLAGYSAEGNKRAFRLLLTKIVGLFTALGILMLPIAYYFGDYLIVLLFGEKYQGLNIVFTLIMVVLIVSTWSNIFQIGVIARREFINHAISRLLLLVLMLSFTIPGVFYGGLEGVAIAMAFAHAGQAVYLYWLLFGTHNQLGDFEKGINSI